MNNLTRRFLKSFDFVNPLHRSPSSVLYSHCSCESRERLRQQSKRRDSNRHVIVHRPAHMFAQSTTNATLSRHNNSLPIKIHREGIRRTFRCAGMASLPRGAELVRDCRKTHSYLLASIHRQQRFCGTSRYTGNILAEMARHVIRKNHRCPVLRMKRNRLVRTDFGAVAALCASLQEEYFVDSARRTQPVSSHRWRRRLFRYALMAFGKFPCRLGHGNNGIFEEVASSVCRIGGHNPFPLHDAVGAQFVDLDAAIAGSEFDIPAGMILANEVQYIALDLVAHILNPRIGWESA